MGQQCSICRRKASARCYWLTGPANLAPSPQLNQRLPPELVKAIISMVGDLDTLRALALVCHDWLPICCSLIHASITIDEWGGPGVMPKEEFLRIYSESPHLSHYVTDISFKLAWPTPTDIYHPYLLSFSKLRSLHLECVDYGHEVPRSGTLSPSVVSLIPRLVVSSALTRLSIVGFTIPSILNLFRSGAILSTNLRSLTLLRMSHPERNPHPIYMVGLHELEIDNVPSFDMLAIEAPSLRSLTVPYSVRNLIPRKCPFDITKLTLKISPNPSWTSDTAFELPGLIRLETLVLQARNWGIVNYTVYFPWFCKCIQQINEVCQLRRLEIRLLDCSSFRTLSASDFSSLDSLFSQMHHGRSLREVDLELTGIESGSLMLTPLVLQPDTRYIKNEVIAGFPCYTERGALRVAVTMEKDLHYWSKFGAEE